MMSWALTDHNDNGCNMIIMSLFFTVSIMRLFITMMIMTVCNDILHMSFLAGTHVFKAHPAYTPIEI